MKSSFVLSVAIIYNVFTIFESEALYINGHDTQLVESTIREVRAAVPPNLKDLVEAGAKVAFIKTYDDGGDDGGNERGYYKRSEDKGNDGYKHFDSFHKKDADKYGYEKHSAFGKYAEDEADAGEKNAKIVQENDNEEQKNEEDDGEETKHNYQVVENTDEDDGDSSHYTSGSDGNYSENYSEGDDGNDGESHSDIYEDKGNEEENSSYEDHSPYTDAEEDGESQQYTADEESDY